MKGLMDKMPATKTKIHLAIVMVIDDEEMTKSEVIEELERNKYFAPKVLNLTTVEIKGVWSNDNPLNDKDTRIEEINRLFNTNIIPI